MELKDLFYAWVPLYIRLPVLFIMLFTTLVANGIFLGNSNEISNGLGVYAEPFTMAYNALYIGMGLGLIFFYRVKQRFSNKRLLVIGFSVMLLMNGVCATTGNVAVFVGACLLIGFAKIYCMMEVYIIWMLIWSKKMDTSRLYPFIYFTALSGIHFTTWLTARLAYFSSYQFSYIVVVLLIFLCILLGLLLVQNNALRRPFPFFQVDFAGITLLAASMMLLNYAVVYGKVEDWFASAKIRASFWGAAFLLLLFIRRQLALKRPLFDLRLFGSPTVRRGLLYFMVLGIFLPGNFQSVFTGGILQYDSSTNMSLNLFMVPGILAGCILCYCWYYFKLDADFLVMAGFGSFVVYHLILYQSFSVSFSLDRFALPMMIKGFGTALTYIACGLLTTRGLKLNQVFSVAGAMILVRSFLGSGIFAAVYTYLYYAQRVRHADYIAGSRDAGDFIAKSPGKLLYPIVQQQATLAAVKELTGWIIIAGIVFLTLLLIDYAYKNIMLRLRSESTAS